VVKQRMCVCRALAACAEWCPSQPLCVVLLSVPTLPAQTGIYDPAFIAANQEARADNIIKGSKAQQVCETATPQAAAACWHSFLWIHQRSCFHMLAGFEATQCWPQSQGMGCSRQLASSFIRKPIGRGRQVRRADGVLCCAGAV
jgi:hypothetical protein